MPPKETKEERARRIEQNQKRVSERSNQHWHDDGIIENVQSSKRSVGTERFKESKKAIAEKAAAFIAKYQDENSDFRKRLAYLQSTLSEDEYKASPEFQCSQIVDEFLENGIQEYSDYASSGEILSETTLEDGRIAYRFTTGQKRANEVSHLKKASEALTRLEERMDGLVNSEYGKSEAFQDFYADIKDLQNETKRITSGGLTVPDVDPDDDYTFHIKLTEKIEVIDPQSNEKVKKTVIREPIPKPIPKPANGDENNKNEYYKIEYRSFADDPLFAHEPCPEDIQQGYLGDCYFIATMSAIADSNPDYIRDCMKDNGDGTVTVRLYDSEQNEIYTTVNKTIPMYQRDNGDWVTAYGRGALWVSILEKAFVQSGIAYNYSDFFAQNQTIVNDEGEKFDANTYKDVTGGSTAQATAFFLGNASATDASTTMRIDFPKNNLPDPGEEYSKEEISFFNKVQAAYNRGDVITAGIDKRVRLANGKKQNDCGLPDGHAYTVIGTYEDKDSGKKYIRVRNPHSRGARSYDANGNPIADPNPERPGESMIELRDFEKTFQQCYAASYNESYVTKRNDRLAQDDRLMYGDAVLQACTEIIDTDHKLVWTNSKTFTDLKKAAISLKAAFKNKDSHVKMDTRLKEFFKAAKAYRDDRDSRNIQQQSDSKNARDRSMKRYQLADAVTKFEQIYKENQVRGARLQYVDFESCKESVLDADLKKGYEGASRARAAAVKGLIKNTSGQPLTKEAVPAKIKAVEQSGLNKIEQGLNDHSSKALIQGLCEVLAARSVKANQTKLSLKEIERNLSSESIKRVQNHVSSKLKDAIKSISKDDFLRIMSSPERSKDMANAVNQHLCENEKRAAAQREDAKQNHIEPDKGPVR